MKLGAAELQQLSSLLDEALALPAPQRARWLQGLPAQAQPLAGTLRALLARHAELETGDFAALPGRLLAALPPAPVEPAAGRLVGPYRLLRELGQGGMGAVWLAERADALIERKVALKLPHVGWSPGFARRFARERAILATLEHAHIARLYDAGVDALGRPYMALEYVEGETIDVWCARRALDLRARLALLLQVAEALAFAHARLVVHRDIKPGNVLVTVDGQVRLLDFGIAKLLEGEAADETELTRAAGRALTPQYASPEQLRGEPIGTASDVYSLGVMACELLSGKRPPPAQAGAGDDAPAASTLAAEPARRRALRGDLDAILAKALRRAVSERYATVDALAQDWRRFLAGTPVGARREGALARGWRRLRRHRIALGIAAAVAAAFVLAIGAGATALVVAALLGGIAAALWQAARARSQAALARRAAEQAQHDARRAQAAQDFVLDIFRANSTQQRDPLQAQRTSARELLDIGAARIGEALKDAPEAQLELRGTLADMYTQLGLRERAREVHRGSVDLARAAYGTGSSRLADVLLGYASSLHESGERARVPALLDEAARALELAGERDSFLGSAALVERARHLRHEGLRAAREAADAALAHLLQHHPQRATLVTAHWLAGIARTTARDGLGAEPHMRAAVDAARRRGDAAPAWLIGPLTGLAEARRLQLRLADAEADLRESEALALRTHGERHRDTLLSRIQLANLWFMLGRADAALALHDAAAVVLDAPDARWGEPFVRMARALAAASWPARGRPDLAEPAQRAEVEEQRTLAPRAAATALLECDWALTLLGMHRLDEAEDVRQQSRARWAEAGEEAAPAQGMFVLAAAALALARGRAAEAWVAATGVRDAAPPERLRLELVRARAALALGRRDDAGALARGVLVRLEELPEGWRPLAELADAHWLLGRALMQAGAAAAARSAWAEALALRRRHDAPGSVFVAALERALARPGLAPTP